MDESLTLCVHERVCRVSDRWSTELSSSSITRAPHDSLDEVIQWKKSLKASLSFAHITRKITLCTRDVLLLTCTLAGCCTASDDDVVMVHPHN